MLLITPHYFTGTVIIDIMRTEYRFRIIRTIRIEFLQVIKEFRRNIPEIYLCIDIYDRTCPDTERAEPVAISSVRVSTTAGR